MTSRKRTKHDNLINDEDLLSECNTDDENIQLLYEANRQMDEYKKEICKLRVSNRYSKSREDKLFKAIQELQRKCNLLESNTSHSPQLRNIVKKMADFSLGDYEKLCEQEEIQKQREFENKLSFILNPNVQEIELVKSRIVKK